MTGDNLGRAAGVGSVLGILNDDDGVCDGGRDLVSECFDADIGLCTGLPCGCGGG